MFPFVVLKQHVLEELAIHSTLVLYILYIFKVYIFISHDWHHHMIRSVAGFRFVCCFSFLYLYEPNNSLSRDEKSTLKKYYKGC